MKTEIKYIITFFQGEDETSEITYCFSDPYIARTLAIKEFKKIQIAAIKQLSGMEDDKIYGIHPLDLSEETLESKRFAPGSVPFALELTLDLGGTQYTLFGAGQSETFEALAAEYVQYQLDNHLANHECIKVFKDDDYIPGGKEKKLEYYLTKEEIQESQTNISEHLIFKELLADLIGYE